MRFSLCILILQTILISFLNAGSLKGQKVQSVHEVIIDLDIHQGSIKHVFEIIEAKTDYRFNVNWPDIDKRIRIDLNVDHSSLAEVLMVLSKEASLQFKQVNRAINVLRLDKDNHFLEVEINEQQSVSGTISDENGEALPGATIQEKGTSNGTITDVQGKFLLDVPQDATLTVSFVGYQTQEILVNGRSVIDVQMSVDSEQLEEIVVVGYGTQQKKEVTASIKQLGGDELASQPSVQTSAALMGKISGVQVIQNSGKPGENQGTIRIRGIGTLGNSNPLVLIDGVQGDLDNIPSTDIESITVLKDASAAAVYGSRAANGVILVTTKRGTQEHMQVNYTGFIGFQKPTRQPKYVNGGEFMRLENLAISNMGGSPVWTDAYIQEWEANYQLDPDNYPNTDWVNEVFSEPGFQQNQNLSVSGGSDNIKFLGSLNYNNELGNVKNFGFKRYTVRLNTDVSASEKFKISFDVNLQRRDREEATDERDIVQEAYRIPPVFVAQYSDGSWGPGWNGTNPVAAINDGGFLMEEQSEVFARMFASYEIVKDVELNFMYSPRFRSVLYKDMQRQYEYSYSMGGSTLLNPAINFLNQRYQRSFTNNLNFTARIQKTIQDHTFSVLGGYEFIDFRDDRFSAFRDNFTLQDYQQLDAGSQANQQNSGGASEWALQSLFGRVNYNFKSKYLIEANLRYDGSSRFTEANRWGIFPSVSAGWVISEEQFLASSELITSLKIRASWGQLGNQQIGTYPYSSVVDLGETYLIQDSPATGAAQLNLANPNISWEKTETSGVGLDLALFDDRLNFTFDYFNRKTSDILLELPIPYIIGLNPPFQNAGNVINTGWEFEIGYRNNIGNDFFYGISGNLSDVKNEVTNLKGAGPFISGNSIITEGYPIGSIYGLQSDGLFQSQSEIDNHAQQTGQIAPGDIRYVDQNDDGVINADDRVVIGDPFPSMNYGINLDFRYKNFDLGIFFQGIGNRDVRLTNFAVRAFYNAGKIAEWQAEDYWSPENPDASYPRLTQGDNHNNFETSDYWVYDASYLRLRNIQVGYSFPKTLIERLSIEKARVFFLGHNLFTLFDDLPEGVDPNVPNGTGGAYYTATKLMSLGLEISF
ncbi:MAG: TonB-dependent receptor [Cyclobacteriaceae bacterium]